MNRDHKALLTVLESSAAPVQSPAKPTGLTATPITTARIDLAWTDAATTETAYKVYRSTNGVDYAQVGTDLAADVEAYSDTTIGSGVPYWYKVAAVNSAGETLSDAATANTLTLSLVAYYKFDDVADATGRGNDLTNVNTATFVAAKVGNGVDLEAGSLQYLTAASTADLATGDIAFTFDVWVKLESKPGLMRIVGKDNVVAREWGLFYYSTTKRFRFDILNAAGASVGTVSATSLGEPALATWYHICGWHDPDTNKLYIQVNNGTVDEGATTGVITAGAAPLRFGTHAATDQFFDGIADESGFWKRILTADERTARYNGGAGNTYPFDDAEVAVDVSSVANLVYDMTRGGVLTLTNGSNGATIQLRNFGTQTDLEGLSVTALLPFAYSGESCKIGLISDLHFGRVGTDAAACLAAAIADIDAIGVSDVFVLGDISHDADFYNDYLAVRATSAVPDNWHELTGNHDTPAAYKSTLEYASTYFTVEIGNIVFIMLGDEGGYQIGNDAIAFLAATLAANTDKNIFIMTHEGRHNTTRCTDDNPLWGGVGHLSPATGIETALVGYHWSAWVCGHSHGFTDPPGSLAPDATSIWQAS